MYKACTSEQPYLDFFFCRPSSQTELMPTLLQNGDASQPHSSTVVENGEASLLGDSSAAGSDQKKSKESILALYGNAATSQPQNMYGMAGESL